MTSVRRILDRKPEVYTLPPDATVLEALKLMANRNIGAVLIMAGEKLVGLFSERDYARKVILAGKHSADTTVREVMTARVVCVAQNSSAEECMAVMTEQRVRHLPVLEDNRVIGLVSIGDVVRVMLEAQRFEIEQLQRYILSGG
jgi:CBS domain-containing protein